ncbi:MAG: hypothetical protein WC337_07485 [Candidatus Muiribacteriota bacterium]
MNYINNFKINFFCDEFFDGKTPKGYFEEGKSKIYLATYINKYQFFIQDVTFDNNERIIQLIRYKNCPDIFKYIEKRVRLVIEKENSEFNYCALRLAIPDKNGRPTLKTVSEFILNKIISDDFNIKCFFENNNCQIDFKNNLLKVDSSRKNKNIFLKFNKENLSAPIIAFIITRIIPLIKFEENDSFIKSII